MRTDSALRRTVSGRPRGLLALLVFTALAVQLGCGGPSEVSNLNPSTFGQTVTFTATVAGFSGTPVGTGIVDFRDGGTTLVAGVPLDGNGKAVFATSSLAIGSHSMTVHYYGDANFAAGDSLPIKQVVRAAASSFYTLAPCRLIDTRGANGPLGGPILTVGQDRTFVLAGNCNIPTDAAALVVNVTVVQASGPGFLSLYGAGTPGPNVSTVNYSPGQVRANNAIVTLGAGGDVNVHVGQGSGTVHLVLDVNGYMQ